MGHVWTRWPCMLMLHITFHKSLQGLKSVLAQLQMHECLSRLFVHVQAQTQEPSQIDWWADSRMGWALWCHVVKLVTQTHNGNIDRFIRPALHSKSVARGPPPQQQWKHGKTRVPQLTFSVMLYQFTSADLLIYTPNPCANSPPASPVFLVVLLGLCF